MLLDLFRWIYSKPVKAPVRAPAVIRPTTNALDPARMLDEAEQEFGATYEPDPDLCHLIYREGCNPDGSLNDNRRDLWNDMRTVVAFSGQGRRPVVIHKSAATTTPGRYYDVDHVIGGPAGAALIAPGQQFCWKIGVHHAGTPRAHEALVQTGGECQVYRDYDHTFRRQPGHITTGWYGINHHSTGGADADVSRGVQGYSAGCLVVPTMAAHRMCMSLLKTDKRYQASPHDHVFDATVLLRPVR